LALRNGIDRYLHLKKSAKGASYISLGNAPGIVKTKKGIRAESPFHLFMRLGAPPAHEKLLRK
jgi:hypothetical protein